MTDLGIVQNPMFANAVPGRWAPLLPGYAPVRMMVDGAFSPHFHAAGELLLRIGWLAALALAGLPGPAAYCWRANMSRRMPVIAEEPSSPFVIPARMRRACLRVLAMSEPVYSNAPFAAENET